MEIKKEFELSQLPEAVWRAFADVRLVADCLPGASILATLGPDAYKGRFAVKVGPLAAAFDGDVAIARDEAARSGTVSGKGADSKSGSRAAGKLSYRIVPADTGTRVEVVCEINLAGALAQFGKAAVIREIANRLTGEFVKNFEARLAAEASEPATVVSGDAAAAQGGAQPAAAPRQPLDAGKLGWAVLRDLVLEWLRNLFGRKKPGQAHKGGETS